MFTVRFTHRWLLIALVVMLAVMPALAQSSEPTFIWVTARPQGIGEEEFAYLGGMDVGRDGALYVTDNIHGVWKLDPATGAILDQFDPDGFNNPTDITIDPATGNLYVANWGVSMIFVLAPDGTVLNSFGGSGQGDGQFGTFSPSNIAIANGKLYATDGNENAAGEKIFRIQVFDLQGKFQSSIDITSAVPAEPSIDVLADGTIYAVSFGSPIVVIAPDGTIKQTDFAKDVLFAEPVDSIDVAPDGTIYAASWNSGVMVIDPQGNLLAEYGNSIDDVPDGFQPQPGDFHTLSGIVVSGDQVFFSDTYNGKLASVSLLSLTGGTPFGIVSVATPTAGAPVTALGEGQLAYGSTITGAISDKNDRIDYTFMGQAGDVVTITMRDTSADGLLDPALYLYDSAGIEVASNDDAADMTVQANTGNAQIAQFGLPADGEYTVRATRFSGSGTFELTLESGSAAPAAAETIRYTATITDKDDRYDYTFMGKAGDKVTITMIDTSADGDLDPVLYLYDPSGTQIADNDDAVDPSVGSANAQIAGFILPTDGEYTVRATRFRGVGSFELTIGIGEIVAGGQSSALGGALSGGKPSGDVIRQWANFATGTSQYGKDSWSFMQATGAPNTTGCSDSTTAWASQTVSGSEILALEFAQPVIPTQVNIHQTYSPGAIIRVELVSANDNAIIQVPNSADPPGNTSCPGVFTLDITGVTIPIKGVILYFNMSIVGNWNEIDAVELVGVPSN